MREASPRHQVLWDSIVMKVRQGWEQGGEKVLRLIGGDACMTGYIY
jgi:hypothetical protein